MSAEEKDALVRDLIIENLAATCKTLTSFQGSRTKEQNVTLTTICAAVMCDVFVDERLLNSLQRVLHITRPMMMNGLRLRKMKSKDASALSITRRPHSHGTKAKLDLDFVYDWFHDQCPLVQVDKSLRRHYTRSKPFCAGKIRQLDCQRRILNGTREQAVDSFLNSDVYKRWQLKHQNAIGERTVMSSICPCIKIATIKECSCPICVQFEYHLRAWDRQRREWHKERKCQCPGCNGPKADAYFSASKSPSQFRRTVCCPMTKYPHLILPHLPGIYFFSSQNLFLIYVHDFRSDT